MSRLIYTAFTSLDGYIEDADGRFDWAMPDEEVHAFANDLESNLGTQLYGRRMYEMMAVWQTVGDDAPALEAAFANVWRALDKIVYSRTLEQVWTPRTTLERDFDAEAVRRLKETSDRDISVSGPGLARNAFEHGLVDEIHLVLFPVVVGGGKPALSHVTRLQLIDQRRFGNGAVHLHYRTR